jgi:hypothetical protein
MALTSTANADWFVREPAATVSAWHMVVCLVLRVFAQS